MIAWKITMIFDTIVFIALIVGALINNDIVENIITVCAVVLMTSMLLGFGISIALLCR